MAKLLTTLMKPVTYFKEAMRIAEERNRADNLKAQYNKVQELIPGFNWKDFNELIPPPYNVEVKPAPENCFVFKSSDKIVNIEFPNYKSANRAENILMALLKGPDIRSEILVDEETRKATLVTDMSLKQLYTLGRLGRSLAFKYDLEEVEAAWKINKTELKKFGINCEEVLNIAAAPEWPAWMTVIGLEGNLRQEGVKDSEIIAKDDRQTPDIERGIVYHCIDQIGIRKITGTSVMRTNYHTAMGCKGIPGRLKAAFEPFTKAWGMFTGKTTIGESFSAIANLAVGGIGSLISVAVEVAGGIPFSLAEAGVRTLGDIGLAMVKSAGKCISTLEELEDLGHQNHDRLKLKPGKGKQVEGEVIPTREIPKISSHLPTDYTKRSAADIVATGKGSPTEINRTR